MPFTISHAAVVLPFARLLARWRLLSAVVVGAMVPDFGLFLPWHMPRFETHSLGGLFTFCLPAGMAAYWVFQYFIKAPLLEVLPDGAYARWRPYSSPAEFTSLRQWLLVGFGVLAGAVTPGGSLIVSGLLTAERNDVVAAFAALGLEAVWESQEDGWAGVMFRKFGIRN